MIRPALAFALCVISILTHAGGTPQVSSATTREQADLVDIRSLVPDMSQSIAYAGSDNFVGTPIDGYEAPRCWLKREAAEALARVEAALRKRHLRLRMFDCYRPARAVAHFVRWANDPADQRTKAAHYPNLDKPRLLGEYIAPVSGHSRGGTVDLTLLRCDAQDAGCEPLDMGTGFDFFGARANTDSREVDAEQRANRRSLLEAMKAQGFDNYPMEWWHYTYRSRPSLNTLYDVPVTAAGEPARQAEIDRLMRPYDGDVPGASLLVLKDGKAVVRRGYGRSDLERHVEAGPATNYRLASVTKQFTAAAILLLAQDRKLAVEDPVRKWLPALPKAADAITLRNLLDHTAGLLDYEDLMAKPYAGQISDAGVLALLSKEDRLYFPPGSTYRYSNSGYAMLALVVERASGMSYPDFVRTRIFAPLGMRDSLAYVAGGPGVPHRAWGYSEQDGSWKRTDQNEYSAVLGDGGIYSNIDDLARWDAALYDDRLLGDATRAQAFGKQVQVASEPEATYYGYGWRVTANGDRLWHSGESIGFRNTLVRWPKQRVTVILLSNRNDPTPYDTALEIGKLFLAADRAEPR
ncbi:serine hydrolase [Rudaea sp.]|uniref:serine hydrolase n=1 Tax=Rudaea sp. TaxID=2136325 RepID=UPI003220844E